MKKMWGSDRRAHRASLPAAYLSFVGFFLEQNMFVSIDLKVCRKQINTSQDPAEP